MIGIQRVEFIGQSRVCLRLGAADAAVAVGVHRLKIDAVVADHAVGWIERTITLDSPRGRASSVWWVTSPLDSDWVRMGLGTSISGELLAGVGACCACAAVQSNSEKASVEMRVAVRRVVIRSP